MALREYLLGEIASDCAEGYLTRREALRRFGLLGLTATAGATLLAGCGSDDDASDTPPTDVTSAPDAGGSSVPGSATTPAAAATTTLAAPPAETALPTTAAAVAVETEEVTFSGPNGELIGVLAAAPDPRGAVLVIHENRGLTAHIRTIPGRLATDGYTALAIDLLSAEGGTAALPTEGDATAALGNASAERLLADLRAGLDELERRAPGAGLAAIGFCFGGGMTWQLLAAGEPRLAAAVAFYGPAPADADFSGSPNAAVLGVYAGLDDRVNASREGAEAGLAAAGLTHELLTFDGVDHAFFNDTGPRYDAGAASQAYDAMLAWFDEHLAA